jgi:hypothetical protein
MKNKEKSLQYQTDVWELYTKDVEVAAYHNREGRILEWTEAGLKFLESPEE